MSLRLSLAALALLAVLLVAVPAGACCIYNNATHALQAQSNIDGMHDWIVHPFNHRCTRGTGDNKVHMWILDAFEQSPISTTGTIWVANHGWIDVSRKKDGRWKVTSFNADGKVHATMHLDSR